MIKTKQKNWPFSRDFFNLYPTNAIEYLLRRQGGFTRHTPLTSSDATDGNPNCDYLLHDSVKSSTSRMLRGVPTVATQSNNYDYRYDDCDPWPIDR
jgi:hypothetical protein